MEGGIYLWEILMVCGLGADEWFFLVRMSVEKGGYEVC